MEIGKERGSAKAAGRRANETASWWNTLERERMERASGKAAEEYWLYACQRIGLVGGERVDVILNRASR
jgi:hypothetical protein